MHSPDQVPAIVGGSEEGAGAGDAGRLRSTSRVVRTSETAAARMDRPAERQGRRILSTAFVMVGPDGHLTVDLRDGRALILRNVVMRRRDYCGVQVFGVTPGTRHCGGYADVAAARPGGAPTSGEPAPLDPPVPERASGRRG